MEFIFELLLIEFIRNTIGVRTRYIFYRLLGKPKTIEYLAGKSENLNNSQKSHQLTFNLIIGLITFFSIFIGMLKILDMIGLL